MNRTESHEKERPGVALSPRQALELLGQGVISRAGFYSALARGEIPHRRLGKRIVIPRHAFLKWLEGADDATQAR
jgi:hypothetical protein